MIIIGTTLEKLESKKLELENLLANEFHPQYIQYLLDKLDGVNDEIRQERRKHNTRRTY